MGEGYQTRGSADLFREFAREVQRELETRSRDADRERVRLERDLAAVDRKI